MYLTDDVDEAARRLDDAIAWCTATEAGPELRTLAKTLRRWRSAILAHHTTGASNGPVEAANLTIKQVKRSGRGFRNVNNYRLRILLAGGAGAMPDSTRHEHPTPPSQVGRVEPSNVRWSHGTVVSRCGELLVSTEREVRMYARLAIWQAIPDAPELNPEETAALDQEFVTLLSDQEGCRGVWQLASDDESEVVFFSLWDTREHAEAAGSNILERVMEIWARHGVTDLGAPPEIRILEVVASSTASA